MYCMQAEEPPRPPHFTDFLSPNAKQKVFASAATTECQELAACPKYKPRPTTRHFARENSARTPEERYWHRMATSSNDGMPPESTEEAQEAWRQATPGEQAVMTAKAWEKPWDLQGNLPDPNVPIHQQRHMGQRWRTGSQRWANSGGQHKEGYALYYKMKKRGLKGAELQFYHPKHGAYYNVDADI